MGTQDQRLTKDELDSPSLSQELVSLQLLSGRALRGTWLRPHPSRPTWVYIEDAVLLYNEQGEILSLIEVENWLRQYPSLSLPSVHRPGAVWLPGFVDTHVHYPQTNIIGSASGPLLDWLETSVFPEESKFAHDQYAQLVADRFTDSLLRNGTTCAAVFSSSHVSATDLLFKTFAATGLSGEIGLTLMDRGAPAAVLCEASEALAGSERLIESWHGYDEGRLGFCVTPRFGLSCTPELLRGAGRLAQDHQLMVQTHISENRAELVATSEAFPTAKDYLGVYEDLGLLHERSLFAHCIWLSEDEWRRFQAAEAAVAHCPDSNFFLGSGQMPLSEVRSREVRMGLGSDVGAGRSFSMRKACARAYDASRITESAVTPQELLWYATRGGAIALHRPRLGALEPGSFADVVAITPPPAIGQEDLSLGERGLDTLISQLIFCEDWQGTEEVICRGISRWERDE